MPGKRLDNGQKDFIIRLYNYFKKEWDNGGPLLPLSSLQQRVAEALGISERTVGRIMREYRVAGPQSVETSSNAQAVQEAGTASTSTLSRHQKFPYSPRKKWKTSDLPTDVKMDVRNILYDMVAQRQRVTVDALRQELANRQIVNMSSGSLRRLLNEMGFKYSKRDHTWVLMDKKSVVMEQAEFIQVKEEDISDLELEEN